MKRFLKKFSLFIAPVLLGLVLCELAERCPDNDYKYKNKYLIENADSIQVLILGSSHSFFGIDPLYFDLNAFNAANVSQSLKYDYFIFDKFKDRMTSLKFVILPISYFSLFSGLEGGGEDRRVTNYSLFYDCPYHKWELRYNLKIYNGIHPKNALCWLIGRLDDNRSCSDYGWGTSHRFEDRTEQWQNSGFVAAKRHTHIDAKPDLLLDNRVRVEKIIQYCKNNNIKVLMLTTPTYYTYQKNLNEEQLAKTVAFCEEMDGKFDNAVYLNMLSDTRFDENDFYDADHLNEFGAEKLSIILSSEINETTNKTTEL